MDRHSQSLIAAKYSGVVLNVSEADVKSPSFLSKFPLGKAPGFEGADGFLMADSSAIARHVASAHPESLLLGGSKNESALIEGIESGGRSY